MHTNSNPTKIATWRWLVGGALALVVVTATLIGAYGNGGDATASSSETAAGGTPANITMLRGGTSDNSCIEEDGEARIYVVITLRNSGDEAGTVEPWATFDYSDGGHSSETYTQNYGHSLDVPAHTEVDATFFHTFNPQQHAMIRCAGYVDLGDNEAAGYYLPMS